MCACINGRPFLSCLSFLSTPSFHHPCRPAFLLSTPSFLHSFFSSFTFFASAMKSADAVVCGGSPTSDREPPLFPSPPGFLHILVRTPFFLPSLLSFIYTFLPSFLHFSMFLPSFLPSSLGPPPPILFFYIFFRLPFLRSFAPSSLLPLSVPVEMDRVNDESQMDSLSTRSLLSPSLSLSLPLPFLICVLKFLPPLLNFHG